MAINFIKNREKIKGQEKTIIPSTSQQTITPDEGYNALTSVTVNAVDNTIDSNIKTGNIKKNVSILGVTGTYEGDNIEDYMYIENKNTTSTYDYRKQIKKIPSVDLANSTSATSLFQNSYSNLEEITEIKNTSNLANTVHMFSSCSNLTTVPLFDMTNVTDAQSMFYNCSSIITIPSFNTNKITNIYAMFRNCSSLVNLPILNTSSVVNMSVMVTGCPNLSDESLNNILQMCTQATSYNNSYKNLKDLGLTSEQASKCTTLSNWSTCEAAGWTTGY